MSDSLRITGLATGMDTEATIKKMMKPYQMRFDKVKQDKQTMQWKQDIYRDIIKDLRDLRNNYLSIKSPDSTNMIKSNTYSGATFSSVFSGTNVNGDGALTAIALPGAINGTYEVQIKQVAQGAKLAGTKLEGLISGEITDFNAFDGSSFTMNGEKITLGDVASIDDLAAKLQAGIDGNGNLKNKLAVQSTVINGKNYLKFIQKTDAAVNISSVKKSDGTTDLGEVSNLLNKSLKVSLSTTLSDLGIEAGKTLSIKTKEGTATVNIDNKKTLQDLINSIYNTKVGIDDETLYGKIKVNFSELTGNLSIETRESGLDKKIEVAASDSKTLNLLGLNTTATEGKDAILNITTPGATSTVEISKSSNNFTIDNVTYNINPSFKVSTDDVNKNKIILTSKPDAKASVDKIKGFVDKYNAIVEKMYERYSEKKQYKYKPLTDEQKKDMKENDIKKWEEEAKKGIIKNDNELSKLLTSMRSALFDSVEGAGISLREIGLDTYGSFQAISKPGQIKLDENKLKNVLETRGDQVMKLLAGSADSSITDKAEKYNKSGVLQRIENILNESVIKFDGSFLKKAGFEGTLSAVKNDLTDRMKKQDQAIYDMERKLSERENKYYLQFAQLEKYMNKMNAQSSWFANQMGGGR